MAEAKPTRTPSITLSDNGPYLVRGLQHLRNSRGETLETGRTTALCRCGGSANKPFCDGTHARIGFSGANTADRAADRVERYPGSKLTILDNRFLCAHVGECTARLESVFRSGKEPWIAPDAASAQRVRETVRHCPSGALDYDQGDEEVRDVERDPAITVSQNGPYFVVGGIALATEAWGAGASREHYALCRCGASSNKPFCDGSHWASEFSDEKN